MGEAQLDLLERLLARVEQAAVLQGWAGFRNVLAHLYGEIDLDRLHAAVLEDKTAIVEFGRIAAAELTDP